MDIALEHELLRQLGERLALRRKGLGLTSTDLATQLGVPRDDLSGAEQGAASVPIGTYMRLLNAYGAVADLRMLASKTPGREKVTAAVRKNTRLAKNTARKAGVEEKSANPEEETSAVGLMQRN